jgi:electron transfer flavoprotein alpha subunit
MTASTAALLSFEESRGLLQEWAGVKISAQQVERAAEALGAEIGADEREQVDDRMGAMAHTLYLGMDGTGVPMRAANWR